MMLGGLNRGPIGRITPLEKPQACVVSEPNCGGCVDVDGGIEKTTHVPLYFAISIDAESKRIRLPNSLRKREEIRHCGLSWERVPGPKQAQAYSHVEDSKRTLY